MERIVLIIQSEGKGHFSQALEANRMLGEAGKHVVAVFIGRRPLQRIPGYFRENWPGAFHTFLSPGFILKSDRKGIRLWKTMLWNLLFMPVYLFEALRIRQIIRRMKAGIVLNFYDPVGAVAGKRTGRKCRVISISHHFYLSHPDFFSPRGFGVQPYLLGMMNRYFIRHSDSVLALSFRRGKPFGKIRVVPPLIGRDARELERRPGSSDLAYLLNEGFAEELARIYREKSQPIDIFTSGIESVDPSGKVLIHRLSRQEFLTRLAGCRKLICTAGFDLVAEAMYLGIQVFLVPSENHFEQYCNALDASRTGMAFHLQRFSDLDSADLENTGRKAFLKWVEGANDRFMEEIA